MITDALPEACRAPLRLEKVSPRGRLAPVIRRVLEFDPAPAYARIAHSIDPYSRLQNRTTMSLLQMFPQRADGFCDCGCGIMLKGRQRRWARPACARFAWYVYAVIAGRKYEIRQCMRVIYGKGCAACGEVPSPTGRGRRAHGGIEFDHIIPVHRGGGACWLSNYKPLCRTCHREKTNADRILRSRSTSTGPIQSSGPTPA